MIKINKFLCPPNSYPSIWYNSNKRKSEYTKCRKAALYEHGHSPNSTTALQTATGMSFISYKLTRLLDHSYLLCKAAQSDCGFVFMVNRW